MEKLEIFKKQNSNVAGYAHFDKKFGINSAWDYITDCKKIKSHAFFPFITYEQVFYKVAKKDGKIVVKDKIRPICYSSHIDRCIYKYYGFLLNEKYNDYVKKHDICRCVVAYRTNLHKNNIHLSKQAFDFIKKDDCYVIIGDFKGFFDNLDHKYLKNMLCKVLCVDFLPDDWYAVFKNITKYSTWDLVDILKLNNLISDDDILKKEQAHTLALDGKTRKAREISKFFDKKIATLNGFDLDDHKKRAEKLALSKELFKKYKKEYVKPNKNLFGIPQGSAISAVLSNVYMIDFDKKIQQFVENLNGLYLRYSDDFIIVIPKISVSNFEEILDFLYKVVSQTEKLTLQSDKTQIYSYQNSEILNITDKNACFSSKIDYLGFIFNGKEVTIRQKTVSKYYYRMYKKLNHIVRSEGFTKNGNRISCNQLYKTYTQKGRNGQYDKSKFPAKIMLKDENNPYKSGNFFSYVYKADKIFNNEPITRDTKRHMLKIRRVRNSIYK